jgi:hypothetical protein
LRSFIKSVKSLEYTDFLKFLYLGVFIGMLVKNLENMKPRLFAALTGMFLYLSLARLFPVLQELVDEPPQNEGMTALEMFRAARQKSAIRLLIANGGFILAYMLLAPLVIN